MRMWWRSLFSRGRTATPIIRDVTGLRAAYARLTDPELTAIARHAATTLPAVVAAAAVIAWRVLGVDMHDEQIQASLALTDGHIVEMQTGEGKTLAAVPAVAWLARGRGGVHVLTANDYLARRDAEWMREIYARMGLSTGWITQDLPAEGRRAAYQADVTYATANEVGFDYLRDGLAMDVGGVVQRPLEAVAAVIDEADSILIDEARLPLVIAGGVAGVSVAAELADRAVRELLPGHHFTVETAGRNVQLTAAGAKRIERVFGVSNLFEVANLDTHAAVQDALHAHALLARDVDYVIHAGLVLSVDEFKGRIVSERRWPAGLQTALEYKEGVRVKPQGRVLGSITVENLVGMYRSIAGMTGTAATQTDEFREIYGLDVLAIPPHRPVARVDHPDRLFATKAEKEAAVVEDVHLEQRRGRPVLVGTASVEESERLSRRLGRLPHHVLNARHEAREAEIIARAGEPGAVTISTNMAGRGVDIRLGGGAADLGGLHVIGTNRHASRRIDRQLRGRAGRQGDPGSSRFFVSREDPLFVTHAEDDPGIDVDQLQRMAEGQHLDIRLFLREYESIVEGQRRAWRERRDDVLHGRTACPSDRERQVRLDAIDDAWSDYLAAIAELRAGSPWQSLGGQDPLRLFASEAHAMFTRMTASLDEDVRTRLAAPAAVATGGHQRGATWTYLTTDEPFGPMTERVMRGLVRLFRRR